jgi:hypothetical protein
MSTNPGKNDQDHGRAGQAAIMLFSWLGQSDAGATSDQSKKDDEMEVKKATKG